MFKHGMWKWIMQQLSLDDSNSLHVFVVPKIHIICFHRRSRANPKYNHTNYIDTSCMDRISFLGLTLIMVRFDSGNDLETNVERLYSKMNNKYSKCRNISHAFRDNTRISNKYSKFYNISHVFVDHFETGVWSKKYLESKMAQET